MTVSSWWRAAEGDRRRWLEREVNESGGRRSRRQSRTDENGYATDEVLGISTAQYSIFDLVIFTPGELETASEKSVGGEIILTILDKCDVRYSTLSFPFGALAQGLIRGFPYVDEERTRICVNVN